MVNPLPWQQAAKVLCVRLDSMGDVLMTTPAIRALKDSLEDRHITLLTSPAGAQVTPLIPLIDQTFIYEAPWMKATARREDPYLDFDMIDRLRREQFDAAVIFTVYSQNPLPAAMLCYLSEIPFRLGYCHENPYQLLTDWLPDPEPQKTTRHEVQRQLDLVAAVGCHTSNDRLVLREDEGDRQAVEKLLKHRGVDTDRTFILVHPGATAPSRRYPWEAFAVAVEILAARTGARIVFSGARDERSLVEAIRAKVQSATVSLAGDLDVGQLAALVRLASVLIVNNTGPAHFAAAVGTPVVDLYALTNPQHTPWKVASRVLNHDVPCKFCYKSICPEEHHDCLRRVTPDQVAAAAIELMDQAALRIDRRASRRNMLEGITG